MEKAKAEVRWVFEGKRNIDETDIEKLDYLKLVVKETTRLHPPGALIPRESKEKCELNGYMISSTTKVVINVGAIGKDPDIRLMLIVFTQRGSTSLILILNEQNLNTFLLEVVRGYVQAYHLL